MSDSCDEAIQELMGVLDKNPNLVLVMLIKYPSRNGFPPQGISDGTDAGVERIYVDEEDNTHYKWIDNQYQPHEWMTRRDSEDSEESSVGRLVLSLSYVPVPELNNQKSRCVIN